MFVGLQSFKREEKSDKEIMREIQDIMRQIASSITYLPCLDEPFEAGVFPFVLIIYTDMDVAVPFTWTESDPKLIANPQMVKLHSSIPR
uniref:Putative HORMA domain, Mitotic spindle checkpoint protein Mad2 n=1 Tax=Helianthus annuus TaxID=4232 RepID=A0A251TGS6_HELAN